MSNKIASFRPGIIANGTAVEAQALIYKYLQKKYGWKFVIFKLETDPYTDSEFQIENIPIKSIQMDPKNPHLPNSKWTFKKQVVNRLIDFDLILGADPTIYPQGLLAAYAADKLNIPLVLDASVTTMSRGWRLDETAYNNYIRWAFDVCKLIWIPTPKVAERFRDIGLRKADLADKLIVLGHPVDTERFCPNLERKSDEKKVVLCVSRLIMEKGIHYIIEAMAPIIQKHRDVTLRIVGEGEARGFLKRIAEDEGIIDNVDFVAPVPHAKLPMIYKCADIFIGHPVSIPDWEEYFGVVNIEAMACGLPVVSSRCGGISHLAREEGIVMFVEERDIIGTTKAVSLLLNDEKLYKETSQRGREYVNRKYSVNIIAEKYKHYLDEIVGG